MTSKMRKELCWILWWLTDKEDISRQVTTYNSLSFFRTYRGRSVACLLFSLSITAAFIYFKKFELHIIATIEIAIALVLVLFIAMGHRWAMVSAMLFWTWEKLYQFIYTDIHLGNFILITMWWTIFMRVFYMAFLVEQEKRKPAPTKNKAR